MAISVSPWQSLPFNLPFWITFIAFVRRKKVIMVYLLFTGNAYVQCTEARSPLPQPECTTDSQCPSQTACINLKCANPCRLGQMCSPDQECRVSDSLPLRTVMCLCPPDTIATHDGLCRRILPQPQCKVSVLVLWERKLAYTLLFFIIII